MSVLLIDIESGGVAGGLTNNLSRNSKQKNAPEPRLVAHAQTLLPLTWNTRTEQLLDATVKGVTAVVDDLSLTAARFRQYPQTASFGHIDRVMVFIHPPWAHMDFSKDQIEYSKPLEQAVRRIVTTRVGDVPCTFHASGSAIAYAAASLFPDEHLLACSIGGEVSELLAIKKGNLEGRATVPHGTHTVVRTLMSHGGLSHHEAQSALRLGHHAETEHTAMDHMAREILTAGDMLISRATPPRIVLFTDPIVRDMLARTMFEHDREWKPARTSAVYTVRLADIRSRIGIPATMRNMTLAADAWFAYAVL